MKKKAAGRIKNKIISKNNLSLVLTITFIAIVLIIIFFVITSFPEKYGLVECSVNSDCMIVQTTCCACEMGGVEKCVPRGQEKIYRAEDCPEHPICIALYNCEVKSCVCSSGKCTEVIGEKS